MNGVQESLATRLLRGEEPIGVIGLGYVGLPLALAFTEAGYAVKGFDIDHHRVERLQNKESYVDDVSDERVGEAIEHGFMPSADPKIVSNCGAYIIAVPTGMNNGEPDMSAVEAAAETISEQAGDKESLVVVSSTVYPGATAEVVGPIVNDGRETRMHLAMVPERINPGGEYEFEEIPLVVGANNESARKAATALFDQLVTETHPVNSTDTAELTKTLENAYRMINIALVNELVTLTEGLDADLWEAIDAASTKPFGFQAFRPGPGVGGHCIPVDPQFLTWRATDIGTDVSFIDDAHEVNERMPALVVNRLELLLSARGVDIADSSIIVLGLAYKPNVGDTRNSPALRVLELLPESADVTPVDPHTDPVESSSGSVRTIQEANVEEADVVLLLVDHDAFDLHDVGDRAKFVFDTRNAMPEETNADVVTLGETSDFVFEQAFPEKTPADLFEEEGLSGTAELSQVDQISDVDDNSELERR